MEQVRALLKEKDALEQQIHSLDQELLKHGVDMNSSLVDQEGYPRADIDVIQVRRLRVSIIEAKNDLRTLMGRIEQGLHEMHAQHPIGTSSSSSSSTSTPIPRAVSSTSSGSSTAQASSPLDNHPSSSSHQPPHRTFARVAALSPDSPAWDAGMKKDDEILHFGHIHSGNHRNLQEVGQLVGKSQGTPIVVEVRRSSDLLTLTLTPRRGWGGPGLLGCHIVPL
ncbi:MAG: 26S proteasome non-ATPase regulatory subunit 9 [Piptocephalis tieghemiana]|nr:MAG: 26S proteasome non-ATPase regulatory subunit 9 [Piptocephalis tieghemiana]